MRTNLTMAVCAIACLSVAAVANGQVVVNAQNCGCANGANNADAVGHCQGYTQAEAEALWAGYCGENCWGNPDQVELPQRRCFGCGFFGCHGGGASCGGCRSGFNWGGFGRRCGCRSSCGFSVGKLFGCRKGLRTRSHRGGACFGWGNGCNSCQTGCGSQVAHSAGCGGCGKCGKCRLGKFKRCLSGRIRCGLGAHAVGYTSAYDRCYVGNACGAMNRAGYGLFGKCCGTRVISNNCGCGNHVATPPTPGPTPANNGLKPKVKAPQEEKPVDPKNVKDGGN